MKKIAIVVVAVVVSGVLFSRPIKAMLGKALPWWLPYDAEVEYLENQTTSTDNSAYILFSPNYNLADMNGVGFYISAWVSSDSQGAYPLGYSKTSDTANVYTNYSLFAASNYFIISGPWSGGSNWGILSKQYGELEWETHITRQKNRRLILKKDGSIVFNGERQVTAFFSLPKGSKFRINSPQWNNGYMAKQRIKHIIMYDYDVVVHDLIPVRFTNEKDKPEGAMYDKVSGKLFRNQGTGKFIIGPDK